MIIRAQQTYKCAILSPVKLRQSSETRIQMLYHLTLPYPFLVAVEDFLIQYVSFRNSSDRLV